MIVVAEETYPIHCHRPRDVAVKEIVRSVVICIVEPRIVTDNILGYVRVLRQSNAGCGSERKHPLEVAATNIDRRGEDAVGIAHDVERRPLELNLRMWHVLERNLPLAV